MSDYTKTTDFAAKDALTSGDPEKVATGTDVDVEFNAIAVAIATKEDEANKGVANGYCPLNSSAKIADTYFPATLPAASGVNLTALAEANITDGSVLARVGSTETITGAWNFTTQPTLNSLSIGYLEIPQNSQSAAYTLVAADNGKHIYHPSADTTARTWTIPANASVAFPIGTSITFVNDTSAGVITIAITSDTLVLAGTGSTGSRSLAANGVATAIKVTSTRWIISGAGLT